MSANNRTSINLRNKIIKITQPAPKNKPTKPKLTIPVPQDTETTGPSTKVQIFKRSTLLRRTPPPTPHPRENQPIAEQGQSDFEQGNNQISIPITPLNLPPLNLGVTPILHQIEALDDWQSFRIQHQQHRNPRDITFNFDQLDEPSTPTSQPSPSPESQSNTVETPSSQESSSSASQTTVETPTSRLQHPSNPSSLPPVSTQRNMATTPLIPFQEVYKSLPKCTGELSVASQFLSLCDGIYEDYFSSENGRRDKEYIRLLTVKLSPEIYSNIRGQSFTTYAEFKTALTSIINPEIPLEDAITSLQKLTLNPKETIKEFGSRVEDALQTLNAAYSAHLEGALPLSLKKSNTHMAIETFANSIRHNETRILVLSRPFDNLNAAVVFAENRLKTRTSYSEDHITKNSQKSTNDSLGNSSQSNPSQSSQQNFNRSRTFTSNSQQGNQSMTQNPQNISNFSRQGNSLQNQTASNNQRSNNTLNNTSFPNANRSFQRNRQDNRRNFNPNETTIFNPPGGDFNSTAMFNSQEQNEPCEEENFSGNWAGSADQM